MKDDIFRNQEFHFNLKDLKLFQRHGRKRIAGPRYFHLQDDCVPFRTGLIDISKSIEKSHLILHVDLFDMYFVAMQNGHMYSLLFSLVQIIVLGDWVFCVGYQCAGL